MKTLIAISLALLWGTSAVLAGATPKPAKTNAPPPAKNAAAPDSVIKTEKRVLTGTYIPQTFRTDGRYTDWSGNVQILSAKSIQLTGAATLPSALYRLGVNR